MARSQADESILQYSRKPRPVGTLATQGRLLRKFANLRDEDAEKFRAAHPDFLLPGHLTEPGWKLGVLLRLGLTPEASARAKALAEVQPNPVLRKRDALRLIWRGDEHADDYLRLLLYSATRSGNRVRFDWKRGEVVYEPQDEFERAVYTLFRNSSLAKVCSNPECPAPYFIAERTTQRYCSSDCTVLFQREWKRNWWRREGSRRRREQRAAKAKKIRKRR